MLQFAEKNIRRALESREVQDFEIFPTAGEQALLHRLNDPSRPPSMPLEETGIPAFETRLRQFLFEGERAQELQRNIQRRMQCVTDAHINMLVRIEEAQGASQEELEERAYFVKVKVCSA